MNTKTKYDKNFYLILAFISSFFIGTLIFIFIVFKSFFWSAFISLIFYIGSRDYYLRIKKRIPQSLTILTPWIMIFLILITIVLPLSIIINNLLKELLSLLFILKVNLSEDKLLPFLMNFSLITDYFTDNEFFWVQLPTIYREIVGSYGDILNVDSLYGILSNATNLIVGGLKIPIELIINSLFTILLLFFFYKDGYKIEQFLVSHLPLSTEIKQKIAYRILDAVKTVLKGNVVISLLQGFVLGLILFFSGISNFVLYAFIGSFFSLIPVVGTAIVWLPAGLYIYFYEGNIIVSILLMSLSFTSYLVLENFLKPAILDKKLNIHPFLLFLSLIGGIQEFGIIGLIIGPVTITIVVILYDFWSFYKNGLDETFKEKLQ